jgi:hypothetical protein
MRTLGGGTMDRKEVLIRLCRELTERVEKLYRECQGVLLEVSGTAQWLDRKVEEELLWSIGRGHRALEESRLKELSWEIRRIVEDGVQDKEEGKGEMEGKREDRKKLLLRLCKELTSAVEFLYHEDDAGLKAHLGEVLGRYASVLSDIGWAITWASEEVQDKVFEVIEDAFRRHEQHRLKCSLEEWLSWKVGEVVEEAMQGEEETETQKPTPETDELPF